MTKYTATKAGDLYVVRRVEDKVIVHTTGTFARAKKVARQLNKLYDTTQRKRRQVWVGGRKTTR